MKTKTNFGILLLLFLGHVSLFSQPLSDNVQSNTNIEHEVMPEKRFEYTIKNQKLDELNEKLKAVDESFIRPHALGNNIAKLYYLFEEAYTYYSEAAPGAFSDTKSIKKPEIYFCINKLDKYYRKAVKKEMLSEELAVLEFKSYIQTAILLLNENTSEFQTAAGKAKSPEEIKSLFGRIRFN